MGHDAPVRSPMAPHGGRAGRRRTASSYGLARTHAVITNFLGGTRMQAGSGARSRLTSVVAAGALAVAALSTISAAPANAAVMVSGSTIDAAGNHVDGTITVFTSAGAEFGAYDTQAGSSTSRSRRRLQARVHELRLQHQFATEYYRDKADLVTPTPSPSPAPTRRWPLGRSSAARASSVPSARPTGAWSDRAPSRLVTPPRATSRSRTGRQRRHVPGRPELRLRQALHRWNDP